MLAQQAPEHILVMDDLTDHSEEEPQMLPLMDDLEVEMHKFPNM
jgi:hypothetical protein